MSFDEVAEIDMRIDYESEWEHNACRELEKLNEDMLFKTN